MAKAKTGTSESLADALTQWVITRTFRSWAKGRRQIHLSVPLQPVPASRPRVSKWGTHYLKTYAKWKKQATLYLPDHDPVFPTEPLVVLANHFIQRARTSRLSWPRGDVDNYLKATLDAITKAEAIWSDDDQVLAVLSTKQFVQEAPRTEIIVVEFNGKKETDRS